MDEEASLGLLAGFLDEDETPKKNGLAALLLGCEMVIANTCFLLGSLTACGCKM
jgi:hypothetical protein